MKVLILTPEKTIYEGEVINLKINDKNSSFQLLDYHASIIVILKKVKIKLNKSIYIINNGILEVTNGKVKILTN